MTGPIRVLIAAILLPILFATSCPAAMLRAALRPDPTLSYDDKQGVRINRDPIAEAGGLNLYGYVGNSPVNRTDPMGLTWVDLPSLTLGMANSHWKLGIGGAKIWAEYDSNGDGIVTSAEEEIAIEGGNAGLQSSFIGDLLLQGMAGGLTRSCGTISSGYGRAFYFQPEGRAAAIADGGKVIQGSEEALAALLKGDRTLIAEESVRFALAARGRVTIYLNPARANAAIGEKSILFDKELPILLANPGVKITYKFIK